MSTKTGWALLAVATIAVLLYTVQRDLRYEESNSSDLRNRVVGARLIKDGRSPYFYKWRTGDPVRYYNPSDFDSFKVSAATASPFFHHLLSPLVEFPQSCLSPIWLCLEFMLFTGLAIFAFSLAATTVQQWIVVVCSLLFLFTNAWMMHVYKGQLYICIPFLSMLFFFCMRKDQHPGFALAAGTVAASLVLIRVNTILYLVPFLFLLRFYTRRWRLAFFLPILLLAAWTLGNRQEWRLWQDYRSQVSEWTGIYHGDPHTTQQNSPDPAYIKWEGLDMETNWKLQSTLPKFYMEDSSIFQFVNSVFHRRIPLAFLGMAAAGIIVALILLFYFRNRPFRKEDIPGIAIFGFCLYMLSDLFSPIYRYQYFAVQWIFPLLLAASSFQPRRKVPYGLLLTGLLLNCIHLSFIKMENTLGEYMILAGLLVLSTFPGVVFPQKSAPASLS